MVYLKNSLKNISGEKERNFTVTLVTPGTEFQKTVWKELRKIPFGETISYQEQAACTEQYKEQPEQLHMQTLQTGSQ